MGRRKADLMGKGRKRTTSGSWVGGLFRFLFSRPVRWIWMLVVILLVLFWQQQALKTLAGSVWAVLGWGVVFVIAAFLALVWVFWRHKFRGFFRRFHWWLGGAALALAIWGILGFAGKGGDFGLWLSGYPHPELIGVLQILGWTILGILLITPRICLRLIGRFLSWLARLFTARPAEKERVPKYLRKQMESSEHLSMRERPSVTEKPPLPAEMQQPIVPPDKARDRGSMVTPEKTTSPRPAPIFTEPSSSASRQDLRQVAEDVWKKYGQSSNLKVVDGWKLPPIEILDTSYDVEFGEADNIQRAKLIEDALASYGVECKVVQINAGPTVTQFGVEPGWDRKYKEIKERDKDGNVTVRLEETAKTRVKVERVTSLANDLALALAAPSLRIEAPVPGKSMIGIEVPNTISSLVSLRGVVETNAFQKLQVKTKLALALGQGAGGEAVAGDLAKMPHLLIAGATGSGKTVCLNTIICCILLHNTPNDVRFIMVDPKRVELTPYNSIPHLTVPVIVDPQKALNALRWLNQEMDKRYQTLASGGARNIEGYNKNREGKDRLPYMVLIIDELADLMMAGFDEVENIICRLAQLARAVGIHLVVATQRPSVDVLTGLIKANFPTRISFAVTSQVDSRTILDGGGAEKLLGKGDMLYMPTEAAKPKRLQGCFLSDAEMERLVYFWNSQRPEETDTLKIDDVAMSRAAAESGRRKDPLLEEAVELSHQFENVSTSFLQRKLHIGYPRAARLMEQLIEELESRAGNTPEGEGEKPEGGE
ncbi:DNA translocase FtsK [Chloroflexota bacterium]